MTIATSLRAYTPDLARQILGGHRNIRVVSNRHVEYLAGEMSAGRWRANGETIKFGPTGELVDGQHRLLAICRSGCTVEMLTVHGVSGEGVDEGRRRIFSDMIFGDEKPGAKEVASLRIIRALEKQEDPWTGGLKVRSASNMELAAFYATVDKSFFSAAMALGTATSPLLQTTIIATIDYQVRKMSGGAVDTGAFFRAVVDGAMLQADSPELILRRWAEAGVASRGNNAYSIGRARYVAFVRAWNAYRRGEVSIHRTVIHSRIHDVALPSPII